MPKCHGSKSNNHNGYMALTGEGVTGSPADAFQLEFFVNKAGKERQGKHLKKGKMEREREEIV